MPKDVTQGSGKGSIEKSVEMTMPGQGGRSAGNLISRSTAHAGLTAAVDRERIRFFLERP